MKEFSKPKWGKDHVENFSEAVKDFPQRIISVFFPTNDIDVSYKIRREPTEKLQNVIRHSPQPLSSLI